MILRLSKLSLAFALPLLLAHGQAAAQFKWAESDGSIAYGDRLPNYKVKILQTPKGFSLRRGNDNAAAQAPESDVELPYALRDVVGKNPTILYTVRNCAPCDQAREHLARRGVPFKERTVNTTEDVNAFNGMGFPADAGLPLLTVGTGRRIGYHQGQWDTLLDLSGYPRQSKLPKDYQNPAPQALAATSEPVPVPASPEDSISASVGQPRQSAGVATANQQVREESNLRF